MNTKKYITALLFVAFACVSCGDKITIKEDFDFEITHLPYKSKNIKPFEIVEVRFTIKPLNGEYSGTKYFIRYWQSSGEGLLSHENDETYTLNDDFALNHTDKKFRLYYTPNNLSEETEHTLDLTFFDSWGHEKAVQLSFSMYQETEITEE